MVPSEHVSLEHGVAVRIARRTQRRETFWQEVLGSPFWTQPRTPQAVAIGMALWLAIVGNWALWRELARLGGAPSLYVPSMITMVALIFPATAALLAAVAWGRAVKPVALLVLLVAGFAQHYMLQFHIVIDPGMVANVVQTDVGEARDLLSARMLADVLLVVLLPALWLWRVPVIAQRWPTLLWRNALLLVLAAAVAVAAGVTMNRQLAPLMRNNPQLRYMVNPLSTFYSLGRHVFKSGRTQGQALVAITGGAALGASYAAAPARPPLLLLVVGETARADHFGINGYVRDTTPRLAAQDVLSWRNAHSCGTSTAASVPCMFSHLGKTGFEARKNEYENLLDVLQAAGLAVLWVDNQAGCKGVCDRVASASTRDAAGAAAAREFCDGDECLDDALLANLDQRIAALPAERTARGVVVVLHQMGSHGPAYYKRSAQKLKHFSPECRTIELSQCPHEALINAFDNSIVQTDHLLGSAIDWLKARERQQQNQTALLYMSDHGESLGEYGIYLHGMPYAFAPESQKHVPMVFWPGALAQRTQVSVGCLRGKLDDAVTHDNLYPTVLGLMDVKTPTYRAALDAFNPCRNKAG